MQNKSKNTSKNGKDSFVTPEQKQKILGIVLFLVSVVLFLSIISYSTTDNGKGLRDSFTNWLGITGHFIGYVFVYLTIGYFSLIFAFLTGYLGYSFFNPDNRRRILFKANLFLILAILIATLVGAFDLILYTEEAGRQFRLFSGQIGILLSDLLKGVVGNTGSVLILFASIVVVLIITIDLKVEKWVEFAERLIARFRDWRAERKAQKAEEKAKNSLLATRTETIRPTRKTNGKKDAEGSLPVDEDSSEPIAPVVNPAEETRIRVVDLGIKPEAKPVKQKPVKIEVRKDAGGNTLPAPEEEEIIPDELPDPDVEDRETEAELPNPWEITLKHYKKPDANNVALEVNPDNTIQVDDEELRRTAKSLIEKLRLFDIEIKDIEVIPGPVVTLFEIKPAPSVKISKIVSLENDIALALAAHGIRIIAPIPGKSAIGVEIPNERRQMVLARDVLEGLDFGKYELPVALGKTINGKVHIEDLAKMPHLLIAGATGAGKSVGINMIIASLLFAKKTDEVKFVMVDPKKIELSLYKDLKYHFLAASPDLEENIVTDAMNAVLLLKSVEIEMDNRYNMLAKAGVRHIVDYNKKVKDPSVKLRETDEIKHHYLPYIVVIIDELADLMMTSGKEVEAPISRLAQLARAVGIHLILATQRPSVNVITGVIKANFSARIAYQVATKIDSRTILDINGADQLLGRGDMLFHPTGMPKPIRLQNAFISTDEVERIISFIAKQEGYPKPYPLPSVSEKKAGGAKEFIEDRDPMFEEAARVIVRTQQGSVSLLQRRLKLGYSRAARIVDQLEEAGIVGPNDGSKARQVIVENEEQLETIFRSLM